MTPTVPRFEELAAPPHWRTVDFISDLHLQSSEPATVTAWQHYLHSTPADALFILGDLFEVNGAYTHVVWGRNTSASRVVSLT